MKKSRLSEPQVFRILKEAHAGAWTRTPDVRQHKLYNVLQVAEYGGMEVSDVKRLMEPKEESRD